MANTNAVITELQTSAETNVFVMMRYRDTPQFKALETAIRSSLAAFGLTARFAKDRALSDDLWANIRLYMENSRYGLAVFEEIHERDFNPNVSLELGFMYAHNRRCLLLKDKRMPRLPTDVCGKIYRDFDSYAIERTVTQQVSEWCERDLGLHRIDAELRTVEVPAQQRLIYDSTDDDRFSSWTKFDTSRLFDTHIRILDVEEESINAGNRRAIELAAESTELVGINRSVDVLAGTMTVEYRVMSSAAPVLNIFFCAIPMQDAARLIEVGASRRGEAANAISPYRVRAFVPHKHVADGSWHRLTLPFDFRDVPGAVSSICAVRINEGCPKPAGARVRIRNVRIFTSEVRMTSGLADGAPPSCA